MKKAVENLRFTTSFHENRPVKLGDADFWSKRLNGEEEMLIQEVNLQSIGETGPTPLDLEVGLMRHVLQARVRDGREITPEWVKQHLGKANSDLTLTYLRTGQGLLPGATLDLPVFTSIEIDGRLFDGRAFSYAELLRAAEASEQADALTVAEEAQALSDQAGLLEGESVPQMMARLRDQALATMTRTQAAQRAAADVMAEALNARIADGASPVTGGWLLATLQTGDITAIAQFLRSGEVADPEAGLGEGEVPNAEADDVAPT
ncbi:hypothetical protein K7W42_19400 [Deinococcus sp. HMF7604]|uniref:hypothetical protein n=1 Tax=Deinococcus betulae TaxID=2873312 RepID=UPI001CCA6943|nr:hypothetical protein [Deinococcus betulae]MBZ9753008.1 hypothetical protein [Deinococcus betulae]